MFAPNADNSGHRAAPDPGNVGATDSPPPDTYEPGTTPTTQILDWTDTPGFPGFDGMEANNALGYTAAAQEAGVPVTYTYISDVHDDQYFANNGNAFGPGEAGHEAQLREYNAAFTAFFHRLARGRHHQAQHPLPRHGRRGRPLRRRAAAQSGLQRGHGRLPVRHRRGRRGCVRDARLQA